QLVDMSLLESAVSLAVWEAGVHFTTGEVPRAAGSAHKLVAPYQAIAAADRHFIVGATTPPTWTAFCRVLGLEGLERDPRYADATLRRHNRDSLIAAIEAITATKPAAHWLAALRAAGRRALDYRGPPLGSECDDVRDVRPDRRDLPGCERRPHGPCGRAHRRERGIRRRHRHRAVRGFQHRRTGGRVRTPNGRMARSDRGRERTDRRRAPGSGRRGRPGDRRRVRPSRRRAVRPVRRPGRADAWQLLLRG